MDEVLVDVRPDAFLEEVEASYEVVLWKCLLKSATFHCDAEYMLHRTRYQIFLDSFEEMPYRRLVIAIIKILILPQVQSLLHELLDYRHAYGDLDLTIYLLLLSQQLVAPQIAWEYLILFVYLIDLVLVQFILL